MREILFRGKTESGKWVEGDFFREKDGFGKINYKIFRILGYGLWEKHEVIPDTIGQYTGLQDKNGVKIFEGDILEITIFRTYEDHHRRVATIWRTAVEYYDGAFTIKDHGETYPLSEYIYPGGACVYQSEFEVIGNIYDNPDLLKVTP